MSISSPITWHGGKSKLAAKIIQHFPEHHTYVEAFGGSAAVLLLKEPSKVEVYNDLDGSLVNLFRVLRNPGQFRKLSQALDHTLYSKSEFELAKEPTKNPVEAARRFIVRQRQSYGGRGERWSFCIADSHAGMSSAVARWRRGIQQLPFVHERFRHVQIEREDWRTILTRYDAPRTLHYIDPTYMPDTRIGGGYDHEMTVGDHRELIARLLASRSMVVLSGYNHRIYKPLEKAGWIRIDFDVPAYSSDKRTRRTECLWLSPTVTNGNGNHGKPPLTLPEKLRGGAYYTHGVRVCHTTKRIEKAIENLRTAGKEPTITAVATRIGQSREHLSRRYRHLFPV
jgi:DNA adenine methylase